MEFFLKGNSLKLSKFSEEQIVAILKEVELGAKATEVYRRHRFSEATYYNRKTLHAGMDISHGGSGWSCFSSLEEVSRMTEDWRYRYSYERPHESLAACRPCNT